MFLAIPGDSSHGIPAVEAVVKADGDVGDVSVAECSPAGANVTSTRTTYESNDVSTAAIGFTRSSLLSYFPTATALEASFTCTVTAANFQPPAQVTFQLFRLPQLLPPSFRYDPTVKDPAIVFTPDITVTHAQWVTVPLPEWINTLHRTTGHSGNYSIAVSVGAMAVPTVNTTLTVGVQPPAVSFWVPGYDDVCGSSQCSPAAHSKRKLVVNVTIVNDDGSQYALAASCPGPAAQCVYFNDSFALYSNVFYVKPCDDEQPSTAAAGGQGPNPCLSRPAGAPYTCTHQTASGVCVPCPAGALCPGGPRLWPLPGYWVSSEFAGRVEACAPPEVLRCPGWDDDRGVASCGPGYDAGSPRCGACESGFYEEDGACRECPASAGNEQLIRFVPVAVAAGVFVVLYVGMALFLWRLFRSHGVPASGLRLLKIPFEYVLWLLIALQLLAQVARASAPGMPLEMRRVFDMLQLVQFDIGGVLPPGCEDGSPFVRYLTVFLLALSLLLVWLSLVVTRACMFRRCPSGEGRRVVKLLLTLGRYGCLSVLLLLYPLTVNLSSAMVECSYVEQSGRLQLRWDNGPYYVCFESEHMLPAVLAIVCLVFVGVGVPALLLCMSKRLTQAVSRKTLSAGEPSKDTGKRGKASHCPPWCRLSRERHAALRKHRAWVPVFGFGQPWFRSAYLYLFLWLAFLQWLPDTTLVQQLVNGGAQMLSLLGFAVAVALLRPDHEWGTWRRWPRFATSVTSVLVVGMQMSFLWDAASTAEAAREEASRSSRVEPLSTARAMSEPSQLSLVLVWCVLVAIAALPLVQLVSFLHWLNSLVPLRSACCGCCRLKAGAAKEGGKDAAASDDGDAGRGALSQKLFLMSFMKGETECLSTAMSAPVAEAPHRASLVLVKGVELTVSRPNPLYKHKALAGRRDSNAKPPSQIVPPRRKSTRRLSHVHRKSIAARKKSIITLNPLSSLLLPSVSVAPAASETKEDLPASFAKHASEETPAEDASFRPHRRMYDVEHQRMDINTYANRLLRSSSTNSRYVKAYAAAAAKTAAGGKDAIVTGIRVKKKSRGRSSSTGRRRSSRRASSASARGPNIYRSEHEVAAGEDDLDSNQV